MRHIHVHDIFLRDSFAEELDILLRENFAANDFASLTLLGNNLDRNKCDDRLATAKMKEAKKEQISERVWRF